MEERDWINQDIIVIGGGAAGFFAAIHAAERNPSKRICILERGKEVLTKVKISGGGRCNVTHAEFLPDQLVQNYPRGHKELRGPFHSFMTGDVMEWFEQRGVPLKTEEDGRVFPESDSSQTIIDLFKREAKKLGVKLFTKCAVRGLTPLRDGWKVTSSKEDFLAEQVLVATGSNRKMWKILGDLGHTIIPGVPSLFTFNINDSRIKNIPGVSTNTTVRVLDDGLVEQGPLLITHWGMSGPVILRLSAWGARVLSEKKSFRIAVNWLETATPEILDRLKEQRKKFPRQRPARGAFEQLPRRLWQNLLEAAGIREDQNWADLNKNQLRDLAEQLTASIFTVEGKSTFKEEFVTAGGVELKEVDFRTFESKQFRNLFLAGEVLNIDAITGGFNFQNAWTGAFLAAEGMTK